MAVDYRWLMARSIANAMRLPKMPTRRALIVEDAEGRNINRVEKWFREKHPEAVDRELEGGVKLTPRKFTEELRSMVPNSRLADCKFLLGVARIYFEDMADDPQRMQSKAARLNKLLKLIADPAHVDDYDRDLNGLSLDELAAAFATAARKDIEKDRARVSAKQRQADSRYTIVKIPDFETASKYEKYVDWCVTHSVDMFKKYTGGGTGVFYFCLRKGFEDIPRERGEGCPLDLYGRSMIAVSVNDDGSLNTCTCRWNHANGGDDHILDTEGISDLLGVDFYKTFKPKPVEEILAEYRKNSMPDTLADKKGWILTSSPDSPYGNYDYVVVSEAPDGSKSVMRFRKVFEGKSSSGIVVGVAGSSFHWYSFGDGSEIAPPEEVVGPVECDEWPYLRNLEGSPRKIKRGESWKDGHRSGSLNVYGCENLDSLKGAPDDIEGGLTVTECPKLTLEAIADASTLPGVVKSFLFPQNGTFKMDKDGGCSAIVDIDDILSVYAEHRDAITWNTVRETLCGDGEGIEFYDITVPDLNDMPDSAFNVDGVTWDDIRQIFEGEDDELVEEGRFTREQCDAIYELLEDDFYEGMGIDTVYRDCIRSGTELEMYDYIFSDVFDELPLDKSYGVQGSTVRVVLNQDNIHRCLSEVELEVDENVFVLYRRAYNYDRSFYVYEPQYGWNGFDQSMWDEAQEAFAQKVAIVMGI